MTAPRQVFGPARANTLADWWEPDQIGKPLTPLHAHWLRRGPTRAPKGTQKALARRGLLLAYDPNDLNAPRLTPEGARARALLGSVPRHLWPKWSKAWVQTVPSEETAYCPRCDQYVSVELLAWDEYDGADDAERTPCVNCVMGWVA